MVVAAIPLSVLFFATGAAKVVRHPRSLAARDHLSVPASRWTVIGLIELVGAVGVLTGLSVAWLGVAAAVGLALLGVGAIATHLCAGDGAVQAAPAVLALLLASVTLTLYAAG